ncbi:unnamed protein product [Closterium sp. NIES-53]
MARSSSPAAIFTALLVTVLLAQGIEARFLPTNRLPTNLKPSAAAAKAAAAASAAAAAAAKSAATAVANINASPASLNSSISDFVSSLNSSITDFVSSLTGGIDQLVVSINSSVSATEAALQAQVSALNASLAALSDSLTNLNFTLARANISSDGMIASSSLAPLLTALKSQLSSLESKLSAEALKARIDALAKDLAGFAATAESAGAQPALMAGAQPLSTVGTSGAASGVPSAGELARQISDLTQRLAGINGNVNALAGMVNVVSSGFANGVNGVLSGGVDGSAVANVANLLPLQAGMLRAVLTSCNGLLSLQAGAADIQILKIGSDYLLTYYLYVAGVTKVPDSQAIFKGNPCNTAATVPLALPGTWVPMSPVSCGFCFLTRAVEQCASPSMARHASFTGLTLIALLVTVYVSRTEAFCYFLPTDDLCNKIKARIVATANATEAGAKRLTASLNTSVSSFDSYITKQLGYLDKSINSSKSATDAAIQDHVSSFEASVADFSDWLGSINFTSTEATDRARSGKAAAAAPSPLASQVLVLESSISGLQSSIRALYRDLRLTAGIRNLRGRRAGVFARGTFPTSAAAGVHAALVRQRLLRQMAVVARRAAEVNAAVAAFAENLNSLNGQRVP